MRAMVYRGPGRVRVEENDIPAIEHVSNGVLKPSDVVTHRVPLGEIAEGYHPMSNKLDGCIKPLVIPSHTH